MTKPAPASEVQPSEQRPAPDLEDAPDEGSNATIHHPDPQAEQHPARQDRKPRSPYVTGNS